jgi:hypothetical protein
LLLRSKKDYRIARNSEIVDWDGRTDSLSS